MCVQSRAPMAAGKWYFDCHSRLASFISSRVEGSFIQSVDLPQIALQTYQIVFDTVVG